MEDDHTSYKQTALGVFSATMFAASAFFIYKASKTEKSVVTGESDLYEKLL